MQKNRDIHSQKKMTEHKFPKEKASPNRAQALDIGITGPKSYGTANEFSSKLNSAKAGEHVH